MNHHSLLIALSLGLAATAFAAEGAFWQPGNVRELFIGGLPADDAGLQMWADNGVNCVTGVRPELAHAHGLRTRTWFTMNYMDSRNTPEERLNAMAAVHEDGSYARPNDPLFPTVGQYGWTACINNPLWIEQSQARFRTMAQDGYDGCHIDFASHYESCFCPHCVKRFGEWAPRHGLGAMALQDAAHATDLPTQMKLREFRIQCVMDFLGGVRTAARAIKPDFATDGTWHHDNGSTYQWAYGDHFDLMCIEGTTWGPFPPASTQVPWLKLAHVLSRRPDRQPVAMSVTYHLLTDAQGKLHHGRMAADRVRVTLAEIISEGAVSWLGLGGPGTGNLLKEHQDLVQAYFRTARDLAPELTNAREVAEIGLLFSPRSYLVNGASRMQLYAFCQALTRAHVPYRLLSDVGLQPGDLSGLRGLVLLDGRALSDEACAAVTGYVQGGGRLLVSGDQAATLGADWQPRADRPAFAVVPAGASGGMAQQALGNGQVHYWLQKAFERKSLGAAQYVTFAQPESRTLAIEGWSKAENVSGNRDSNYALYVDMTHTGGGNLWGQVATFDTGTHDWQFSRTLITAERPFQGANVHLLFRGHGGTAWFKDVRFGVWDPERRQIVQNLLGSRFQTADGKTMGAADGGAGTWAPYGDGYTVENMLEQGWWVKTAAERGLDVGPMHVADAANEAPVLAALKPLLDGARYLEIRGQGAELVGANLTRTDTHLTLHLVNYAAELHPELPELEQQQREHSLPARNLSLTLNVPGLKLKSPQARLMSPEGQPTVQCQASGDGATVRLSELAQYAALVWELR
ncbi:hypothetical protein LLH23_09850 [bacterium]|nr:hypothetical protein [bacterium]